MRRTIVGALFCATALCVPPAAGVMIDFTTFPDGTAIPDDTVIRNQFEPWGVVFQPVYPNGPKVLTALDGILISGGPTGFYGDIEMAFTDPVSWIAVDIIGSGLNIRAQLEAFNPAGGSLGTVTHLYTGNTGQPSTFWFVPASGQTIASARYNGALNPPAASVASLAFEPAPVQPIPEPASCWFLGFGLLAAGMRGRFSRLRP